MTNQKHTRKSNGVLQMGNQAHENDAKGSSAIERPTMHENAIENYAKVKFLIENGKFDEAYSLTHVVIEWMPGFSKIFWLRVLAKNRCTSADELIQRGFDCESDADFCNALAFSSAAEHNVYLTVRNTIYAAKKAVRDEILNHEYQCKLQTNVFQAQREIMDEVEERKKKLYTLWCELEKTEQYMYILEKDCQLVSKEYRDELAAAAKVASEIKAKVYQFEECSSVELHEYRVKIGNVLQQSERAKGALESMIEQHPWVQSYNGLVKKRNAQVNAIEKEISALKIYGATVQQTIDDIKTIEERHQAAIRAVESYDFLDAASLLGRDSYSRILRSIGLSGELRISVPVQDWQLGVGSDGDNYTWNSSINHY